MKHLEPLPATKTTKKSPAPRPSKRSGWRSLFFVVASILIMGFSLTSLFQQSSGDTLSVSKKTQIADEFSKVASLQLETIPAVEIKAAIDSMGLDQQQRAILENGVRNSTSPQLDPSQDNTVKMMWLELWDFASQDGDSVSISSAGYRQPFHFSRHQRESLFLLTPIRLSRSREFMTEAEVSLWA